MQTFRRLDHFFGQTPAAMGRLLSSIDIAMGRQEAFRKQNPAALKTLIDIALVQSVESSNAIENITAPHKRIEELVAGKTTPLNRSEEEIAGYRDVLNTLHSSAPHVPIKRTVIEQLHRDLYKFSAKPGGTFKSIPNSIEETLSDGTKVIRFEPVGVFETPGAVEQLCGRFADARDEDKYHPLLLTAAFVLDFLCIHPFSDGNGRISRLLTLLALYQADYEAGRFISLERLIEGSKETYYDALGASSQGWHDGVHDIEPWVNYFLGIIVGAYKEFEERAGTVTGARGAKAAMIKDFVRSRVSEEFSVKEIRQAVPTASDVYIRRQLKVLRDQGAVKVTSAGRTAKWRRLHTNF
jgi:Fic family protein